MAISKFTQSVLDRNKRSVGNISPFTQSVLNNFKLQPRGVSTELPETFQKSIKESGVIKQQGDNFVDEETRQRLLLEERKRFLKLEVVAA